MAEIVVIGAGLSGTLMAYELLPQLRPGDRVTVVSQGAVYHFVPSNPWVAVGWRKQSDIEIDLVDIMKRKGFDAEIGLGVLDVHTHKVETVEEVVKGIKMALEVLPPEKIFVDPDCGLKTRTWDEASAKIKVMIEAVRRVKAETGIE